jgi:HSP20 family protein
MATETEVKQEEETRAQRNREATVYKPHVDILEEQGELTLRVNMPGVGGDVIEINFADGVLTIQGKVRPRYEREPKFLLREYGIGDFYRTFQISEQVDASRISAEYKDGVLTVHLPKVEAAKPRKIDVRTG